MPMARRVRDVAAADAQRFSTDMPFLSEGGNRGLFLLLVTAVDLTQARGHSVPGPVVNTLTAAANGVVYAGPFGRRTGFPIGAGDGPVSGIRVHGHRRE